MMRRTWWMGVALAALVGCQENNEANFPKSDNAAGGPAAGQPAEAPSAGVMTGGASGAMPPGYPGPKDSSAPAGDLAKPADESKPAAEGEAKDEQAKPGDQAKAAAAVLSEEELAGIKELPEAEQADALAQKLCPVSSKGDPTQGHLGSMGMPYKVIVEGKPIYLCCEGCKEEVEKDPKGFLARVEALKAASKK